MTNWLAHWLKGWLTDLLTDSLIELTDWLTCGDSLTSKPSRLNWWSYWLTNMWWFTDWSTDSKADWLTDNVMWWLTDWPISANSRVVWLLSDLLNKNCWLTDYPADSRVVWPNVTDQHDCGDSLTSILIQGLSDWLTDWLTNNLCDSLTAPLIQGMSNLMTDSLTNMQWHTDWSTDSRVVYV